MADLESALHYILRVEVGKFSILEGQRLVALKKFIAVLAQVSRSLTSRGHVALHRISVLPLQAGSVPACPPAGPPPGALDGARHLDPQLPSLTQAASLQSNCTPPQPHATRGIHLPLPCPSPCRGRVLRRYASSPSAFGSSSHGPPPQCDPRVWPLPAVVSGKAGATVKGRRRFCVSCLPSQILPGAWPRSLATAMASLCLCSFQPKQLLCEVLLLHTEDC